MLEKKLKRIKKAYNKGKLNQDNAIEMIVAMYRKVGLNVRIGTAKQLLMEV